MASILRQLCRASSKTSVIPSLYRQTKATPCLFYASRLFCDKMVDQGPDQGPPIPAWEQPKNETLEIKRSRLLYQSRKRGMSENGLLLSTFAHEYLDTFTEAQVDRYDKLINQPSNDWDIYYWMTNIQPTPEEFNHDVMDLLKKHTKNEKMEMRIVQPELKESTRS